MQRRGGNTLRETKGAPIHKQETLSMEGGKEELNSKRGRVSFSKRSEDKGGQRSKGG